MQKATLIVRLSEYESAPKTLYIDDLQLPKFKEHRDTVILATAIINDFQNNLRDPCHVSSKGKNSKECRAIDFSDFEKVLKVILFGTRVCSYNSFKLVSGEILWENQSNLNLMINLFNQS